MAVLLDSNVTFRAGSFESPPFNVVGRKQLGVPLTLEIDIAAAPFPTGTTTLFIMFSFDGGTTWPKSASMTVERPRFEGPKSPQFEVMAYTLGANDDPTDAMYVSVAPAQFQARVIVSAT